MAGRTLGGAAGAGCRCSEIGGLCRRGCRTLALTQPPRRTPEFRLHPSCMAGGGFRPTEDTPGRRRALQCAAPPAGAGHRLTPGSDTQWAQDTEVDRGWTLRGGRRGQWHGCCPDCGRCFFLKHGHPAAAPPPWLSASHDQAAGPWSLGGSGPLSPFSRARLPSGMKASWAVG